MLLVFFLGEVTQVGMRIPSACTCMKMNSCRIFQRSGRLTPPPGRFQGLTSFGVVRPHIGSGAAVFVCVALAPYEIVTADGWNRNRWTVAFGGC